MDFTLQYGKIEANPKRYTIASVLAHDFQMRNAMTNSINTKKNFISGQIIIFDK